MSNFGAGLSTYVYYEQGNTNAAIYNAASSLLFEGSSKFFKYAANTGNTTLYKEVDDILQVFNMNVGKIVGSGANYSNTKKKKK